MKAPARAAGAEIIPAELLEKLLVSVDHAVAAAHLRFGGISPSSAYWRSRKDGRLSKSSSCRMTHLLFMGAGPMLTQLGGECARLGPVSRLRGMWGAVQRGDAPVGALGLKMLHDAPSFINVRAAGDRCCSPDL